MNDKCRKAERLWVILRFDINLALSAQSSKTTSLKIKGEQTLLTPGGGTSHPPKLVFFISSKFAQ
jgi:hypothetical protein